MKEVKENQLNNQLDLFELPALLPSLSSHLQDKNSTLVQVLKSEVLSLTSKKKKTRPKIIKDSFIVSGSNEKSYRLVQEFIKNPRVQFLLIGEVGLGKSHLLKKAASHFPKEKTLYLQARDLRQQFLEAELKGTLIKLKSHLRQKIHFILLDDLDECFEHESFLLELCDLMDYFFQKNKGLFFTLKKIPKKYSNLSDKVKSRLHRFIIQETRSFDAPLALDYLKLLEKNKNIEMSQDLKNYLIYHFGKNAFSLESAFNNLRSVNKDKFLDFNSLTAQEILAPLQEERIQKVQGSLIIKSIAEYFKISEIDLKSKSRKFQLVFSRHMAMYILHQKFSLSLAEIGRLFEMHHASIIHGVKRIQTQIQKDQEINSLSENIFLKIESSLTHLVPQDEGTMTINP